MPKVRTQATKMSDATVSFISLVERGANRSPFKIIKQEAPVKKSFLGLDLANMLSAKKSEVKAPEIVATITMKSEGFESVKKQFNDAGFKTEESIDSEDGAVVFKQEEYKEGDTGVLVRINDHAVVVTKNFEPDLPALTIGGKTFEDIYKEVGFVPGLGSITGTLQELVVKAAQEAETPEDAEMQIDQIFEEVKKYSKSLARNLPSKVFTLEGMQVEVEKKCSPEMEDEEEKKKKAKKEEEEAAKPAEVVAEAAAEEKKDDPPKVEVKKEEIPAPVTITKEDVLGIVSASMEALSKELSKKLETSIGELSEQVKKSVGGIEERIVATEKVAKAAQEKVAGIVVGGNDLPDLVAARKSERSSFGGEIDTAFGVRRRQAR